MEAPVQPITLADFPEDVGSLVQRCRGKDGETLVLEKNLIVEKRLAGAILRRLSEDEMAAIALHLRMQGKIVVQS